jgi:hypothetical protein
MRDKGYRGFASREAYEAYYSGPLPKWETDAMAAYVHETEQERVMIEKQRPPAPAPIDDLCECPRCGRIHRDLMAGEPPTLAPLDDRLRIVDLRSVIQNVITRCHDRGEGFDIMALEAACAVRDVLRADAT